MNIADTKIKYCLVTSSETSTWDEKAPLVFMDGGCLKYNLKDRIADRKVIIFDDIRFLNSKEYKRAQSYVENLCERLVIDLAENLNRIQKVEYDIKSWNILLRWWIHQYISYYFYKYQVISDIKNKFEHLTKVEFKQKEFELTIDTLDFQTKVFYSEHFNEISACRICKWIGIELISKENVDYEEETKLDCIVQSPNNRKIKDGIYDHFLRFLVKISRKGSRIVYNNTLRLDAWNMIKAALIGKISFVFEKEDNDCFDSIKYDKELRKRISFEQINNDNEFERMIAEYLPRDIPLVYIEGFDKLKNDAIKHFGINKCIFYSQDAWFNDELAKSYIAYARNEYGMKLHGIKHGGSYVFCRDESAFDMSVCDYYYTMGWNKTIVDCNVIPMPSPKLSSGKYWDKQINDEKKHILFIGSIAPRYIRNFDYPFMVNVGKYLKDQIKLIHALNQNCESFRCRLMPVDWNWCLKERVIDNDPDIICDGPKDSFFSSINAAELCIMDIFLTTWTEIYIRNIPFMVYTPVCLEDYFDEEKEMIEALKQCKVYFNSMEEMVETIKGVEDFKEWWNEPERKNSVRRFAERHTLHSENWQKEWLHLVANQP